MSKDISSSRGELEAFVESAVASGQFPNEEAAYAHALKLLEGDVPIPRAEKRQGGQWRGQVTIAPDFDEDLPDDLAESFGMK